VALSMEEQRMLDEMERQLAADDPRLASRFSAFGQQHLPGAFSSQRAKTISGLIALALIAAVTVMMFVFSPYSGHQPATTHGARGTNVTSTGTGKSHSAGSDSTGSDSGS
jgi:Protein of unknown function (DUF3040)